MSHIAYQNMLIAAVKSGQLTQRKARRMFLDYCDKYQR